MMLTLRFEQHVEDAPALDMAEADDESGAAIYRVLAGREPHEAQIDDDASFDVHVLASILAIAAADGGIVNERAGLRADDLALMLSRWFPHAGHLILEWQPRNARPEEPEVAAVRELLSLNSSTPGDDGRWLAAMVARRAFEPNHLWEDLGLRSREELTRLLNRHFAPLAQKNTRNMRWKRFFYRQLCEGDGFLLCSTPICTDCNDFELCFGDESGESRLARRNRAITPVSASI
jgi:nitrogen fixation protein NifQ